MAKSRRGLTLEQFNAKYKNFLEDRFYGLAINNQKVIDYLDAEFEMEITNGDFQYSQIKTKFDSVRCYTNSDKNSKWESHIQELLKD